MGTAHVEIFQRYNKNQAYPGQIKPGGPVLSQDETTSTTATTAGSRITCPASLGGRDYFARIIHDEACYVMIGADPTAVVPPGLVYKTVPAVALELPIRAGEKISFKEVA